LFKPASGGLFGGKPLAEPKKEEPAPEEKKTSLFGGPIKTAGSLFGGLPAGGLFGAAASSSVFQTSTLFASKPADNEQNSETEEENEGEKSPPTYADPDKVEFKATFGQSV
jgi:hypothetical protein